MGLLDLLFKVVLVPIRPPEALHLVDCRLARGRRSLAADFRQQFRHLFQGLVRALNRGFDLPLELLTLFALNEVRPSLERQLNLVDGVPRGSSLCRQLLDLVGRLAHLVEPVNPLLGRLSVLRDLLETSVGSNGSRHGSEQVGA